MNSNTDNNEVLNSTEDVCVQNDIFPSDMTEYYYRCRISNIELSSQKFYCLINTILGNAEHLIKGEINNSKKASKNECPTTNTRSKSQSNRFCNMIRRLIEKLPFAHHKKDEENNKKEKTRKKQFVSSDITLAVLKQLIKYNDDFHKVSMRLIRKEDINSFDSYSKQFKLLMCIVNETVVLLSEYVTLIKSKKLKKISLSQSEIREYQKYDFAALKNHTNVVNHSDKAIKLLNLVNSFAEIPQGINADDSDTLIFLKITTPFSVLFLVIFLLLIIFVTLILAMVMNGIVFHVFKSFNSIPLLVILSAILSVAFGISSFYLSRKLIMFTLFSPNFDYIERRNKAYKQSKQYVIHAEAKTKKNKENLKWIINKLFELLPTIRSK